MDALSLVFGVSAFDLPGLKFPDWTPSQTSEVPAALFMFGPDFLGFLGLRRKVKS